MSYSVTHYCTAIFGSLNKKPSCWGSAARLGQRHVVVVVVVESTARDYLHLCFKNTVAELV